VNRRILLQAAAPSIVVGLLLSAACLGSAWYINRLEASMAGILAGNVSSLRAAQDLEISLRQLRFRCFLYLIAPDPGLLPGIQESEHDFSDALERAKSVAETPDEWRHIRAIEQAYLGYQLDFDRAQEEVRIRGPYQEFRKLAAASPVEPILDPCHGLFRVNEAIMTETFAANEQLNHRLRLALFFLGLGGPVGGLIMGYGLARGWSRSIQRLSVQVQDMAQRLDQDVASVQVVPAGDPAHLDQQLQVVVNRVQEVVERLQVQQREMLRAQQMTAVGQLAASVAHEVRNPLTAIKMLVEAALRSRNARPFTEENLQVVHREVVRLERTVQDFLSFARPPALQRSVTDLREVVRQSVSLIRPQAAQQHVVPVIAAPLEATLSNVDADQLSSVLVNLLMNALDAMPSGGQLHVGLATAAERVIIRVSDSGRGIDPEMRAKLFTPFASTKATGTGLGLSISRRIVEEHGGRLECDPQAAAGACFVITLPLSR